MGIDFVTLLAQLINLGILIWLLKRFLYQPILKMIDERQALIDNEIRQAKQATLEAEKEKRAYQKQLADFNAQKDALYLKANEDAEQLKHKLASEAKTAVQVSHKNWQQELASEKQAFDENLQTAIIDNFKTFAADALHDMADTDLTTLILRKFESKFLKLPKSKLATLAEQLQQLGRAQIETDCALPTEQKKHLQAFIIQSLGLKSAAVKFVFKVNPELISGIQILAGEQMISWNLNAYLTEFNQNMDAAYAELLHQN